MPIEKRPPSHSVIDILDRVLDKGLVIDAWIRVSIAGIELVGVEARVIVASITTYVKYSATVADTPAAARPALANAIPSRPAATSSRAVSVLPARRRLRAQGKPRRRHGARRQALVNARCERGCTFAIRRDAIGSSVTCPFDARRTCTLGAAPAA